MSEGIEYRFPSGDKVSSVYVKKWITDQKPKAVIQIIHGLSEHIGRYEELAKFFNNNGFIVVGNDHLGHGRTPSEGQVRGFFSKNNGWDAVVSDVREVYKIEKKNYPSIPYFMLGHSMGSFILRTYIIKYPDDDLAGILISGTGHPPRTLIHAAQALAQSEIKKHGSTYHSYRVSKFNFGQYNADFSGNKTVSSWISSDMSIVKSYYSDPLRIAAPTVGLFADMFEGVIYISDSKNLKKMRKNLPIYFFSGNRDPIGEAGRGVIRVYKRFLDAGCTDIILKLYHGRHEMLNETCRQDVYKDILSWINGKI